MGRKRIDSIIVKEAIEKELQFLASNLDELTVKLKSFPAIRIKSEGAGNMKELSKAQTKYAESLKAVESLVKQRFASEARLATAQTDYAAATARNRNEIQKLNKEQKIAAEVAQSQDGSIGRARANIKQLTQEQSKLNLVTAEGRKRNEEINQSINRWTEFIRKNVSAAEKQRMNVGNYQGSAKIIVDALERARQKVVQVEKDFGKVGPEARAARVELEALERVTDNPQFLNIAAKVGDTNKELRFFTQQLNVLEDAGMKNSQIYRDMQARLAELTDQIADTKAEVKALASDTRNFDLFAGSVNFAADAFQTFAGAAALAGASEEQVAEQIRTLVAIQSVANGVKGIANELTTKGTAANKAYAFIQGLVSVAMDKTAASAARLNATMGLIAIAATVIGAIAIAFAAFGNKAEESATKVSVLNDVMGEANGEYTKAVTLVGDLRNKLQLAKEGFIDKEKTLKYYNETIGKTTGEVKSLNEAEQALAKNADAYIRMVLYKAAAQQAFNEAAKLTVQLAMEQQDPNSRSLAVTLRATDAEAKYGAKIRASAEYQKKQREETDAFNLTITSRTKENIEAYEKLKGSAQSFYEEQLALLSGGVKAQNAKSLEDIGKDYERKAAEISGKFKFNFFQDDKDKKNDTKNDEVNNEKKAAYELRKLALERLKAEQEAIMSNVNFTSQFRISAAENIARLEKQIIKETADFELENKKLSASERLLIEAKKADEIVKVDQELSSRRLSIAEQERQSMSDLVSKGAEDFYEEQNARFENQLQADEKELNQKVLQAQIIRDQDLKLANENFQSKFEAVKGNAEEEEKLQNELNKRKEEIDLTYQRAVLANQIAFLKKRAQLFKAEGKDVVELEAAIARAEAELANSSTNQFVEGMGERTESLAKLVGALEMVKDKFSDFSTFVTGISDAIGDREKNRIQEQLDNIEKWKAAEIDRITASGDTEEKKAARIKLIEAKAAADRERLERRKREEDIKSARLQKALTIMQIILTNALNVAKAVGSGNPAKVVYAIAMGVAQLAVAIATPIPQFAKGKTANDPYEGPAIVGEAGREIGQSKEGKLTMYDRPTLTYLRKGDIIHPNRVAEDMVKAAHSDRLQLMNLVTGGQPISDLSGLEGKTDKVIDQLRQLNKRPMIIQHIHPGVDVDWLNKHLKY